jgi:hypothetical protein
MAGIFVISTLGLALETCAIIKPAFFCVCVGADCDFLFTMGADVTVLDDSCLDDGPTGRYLSRYSDDMGGGVRIPGFSYAILALMKAGDLLLLDATRAPKKGDPRVGVLARAGGGIGEVGSA